MIMDYHVALSKDILRENVQVSSYEWMNINYLHRIKLQVIGKVELKKERNMEPPLMLMEGLCSEISRRFPSSFRKENDESISKCSIDAVCQCFWGYRKYLMVKARIFITCKDSETKVSRDSCVEFMDHMTHIRCSKANAFIRSYDFEAQTNP